MLTFYFASKHYFSSLNTFVRKGKDPEPDPDPYLWLMELDSDARDQRNVRILRIRIRFRIRISNADRNCADGLCWKFFLFKKIFYVMAIFIFIWRIYSWRVYFRTKYKWICRVRRLRRCGILPAWATGGPSLLAKYRLVGSSLPGFLAEFLCTTYCIISFPSQ